MNQLGVDETSGGSAINDGSGFVDSVVPLKVDGDFQDALRGDSGDYGSKGMCRGPGHRGSTGDWGKTRGMSRS